MTPDAPNGQAAVEPLLLTIEQVAARLTCSENAVKHLHRMKKLRAVRGIGLRLRWRHSDVVEFVKGLS